MAPRCAACGEAWVEKRSPGFRETCLKCGEALHRCVNCRFYAAGARDFCREPAARDERPRAPEETNRCSWFVWTEAPGADGGGAANERERRAKAALEALFAPPPEPEPPSS